MELEWQEKFYQIKDRGLHLLQTEKWADCRFLVGDAPTNQKIIAGHKLILAISSPVFEGMFYGQLADKEDPIVIPDIQPDAFQAMLEYIYSDRINIASFHKACELCYVAKKYMLSHLVGKCTTFLKSNLSPSNACEAYEFGKLLDEEPLVISSMEFIALRTREVLADPGFIDIEISTIIAILDRDKLNIDSELDLFNALLRFANERWVFGNDSIKSADQTVSESVVKLSELVVKKLLQIEKITARLNVDAKMQDLDDSINDNQNYNVLFPLLMASDAHKNAQTVPHDLPSSAAAKTNGSTLSYVRKPQYSVVNGEMLRKAVKKIRFLAMSAQEFSEGPARSQLLQQHEALAFLIKILNPSMKDCPVPEGFSHSKCSRNLFDPQNNTTYLADVANFKTVFWKQKKGYRHATYK